MYHLEHDAFPEPYRVDVEESIPSSAYIGNSPLGPEFVKTLGFSVVFRRSVLAGVLEEFGFLRDFLGKAIFPKSNAFYVNPLVMGQGSRVAAHIDCRLLVEENLRIIPTLVSIFYVARSDEAIGGEITLNVGTASEVTLQPRQNDLLHFRGNLVHAVSEIRSSHRRISLVCEQYNLPEQVLEGFPAFNIIQDERAAPRVRPMS
jgi:hypothetical protein